MTSLSIIRILNNSAKQLVLLRRANSSQASDWVSVYGMYGSPYTRKVQAALRYKQIPFTQHPLMPGNVKGDWDELGFSEIKPKVIPVVKYGDGQVQNDSTFILETLDKKFPTRPVVPSEPLAAFLALLFEDIFDEWGTKVMFGMRWLTQEDRDWSGRWLLYDMMLGQGTPLDQVADMGRQFGARQTGRMKVVGCQDPALVHRSAIGLLAPLERHLEQGKLCLLGASPTVADFALYGQLSQLLVDRTPDRLVRDSYPACWAWVRRMEDMSGLEADVLGQEGLEDSQYVREVMVTLWGSKEPLEHRQPVFGYQAKCLSRIQAALANLPADANKQAKDLLAKTNCIQYLE